ncbi:MAG: linear amide C-N hydrolase [Prevotella sp.]|nr:linear amide C-N hydrolase [Prevotella sp.]
MKRLIITAAFAVVTSFAQKADACTGITLRTTSGSPVTARTIEWAGNDLESKYSIVPRGYSQRSFTPGGQKEGMMFTAKYGYVGLAVEQPEFVVEGINEAGLAAGLFYFPGYGEYETYNDANKETTVSDLQLVSWILSNFKSVNEVKNAIYGIHVVAIDPRGSTVHWRITEPSGRQVVLEIVGKQVRFYDNKLGVLTNSPGFDWHLTNLNNYTNLFSGPIYTREIGDLTLTAFGGGGGLHGIPGDMTPPSRFVRAAFFQATAPKLPTTEKTVMQAFHILNNFDIPTGIQFSEGQRVPDIPSATQWTVATDITNRRIYYRTMHNSTIRCFDLRAINFSKVKYQSAPLDEQKVQPVEMVKVK